MHKRRQLTKSLSNIWLSLRLKLFPFLLRLRYLSKCSINGNLFTGMTADQSVFLIKGYFTVVKPPS